MKRIFTKVELFQFGAMMLVFGIDLGILLCNLRGLA